MFQRSLSIFFVLLATLLGCGGGSDLVVSGGITITITPSALELQGGESHLFQAHVTGGQNRAVTWKATGGTMDAATGLFTASMVPGNVLVMATSVADPSRSASVTVVVRKPQVGVVVEGGDATLFCRGTRKFTATVTGHANTAVKWSCIGGSIDAATGIYVAPGEPGEYLVLAASVVDPTVTGTAKVQVLANRVTVEPENPTLLAGATRTFTARVNGVVDGAVTWTCSGGTIDATTGFFTAPATAGVVAVVATMKNDANAVGSTTVTVVPRDIRVVVTPSFLSLETGDVAQFTATVTGASDSAVTWTCTGGSVDARLGIYTAPDTPGRYWVLATSRQDATRFAAAEVVVRQKAISVEVWGTKDRITVGETCAFHARVSGTADLRVTWSCTGGSIDAVTGLYTAPSTPGTYAIIAASKVDAARYGMATITVLPQMATVTVEPAQIQLAPGQVVAFRSLVAGVLDSSVTWSCSGGFIDAITGVYTASGTPGVYTVIATSRTVPSVCGIASVRVIRPLVSVQILQGDVTVAPGSLVKFAAQVTGTEETRVTWKASGGTIDADTGLFQSPEDPGVYLVTAVARADASVMATAIVTVQGATHAQVVVEPPSAPIPPAGLHPFKAKVLDAEGVPVADQRVVWSLVGAPATGTLDAATGVFIAPASVGAQVVMATTVAKPVKSGLLRFVVGTGAGMAVRISPESHQMVPGGLQMFTAVVDGAASQAVVWRVLEPAGGTFLGNDGLYQAPLTPGIYTLSATSVEVPTLTAAVQVRVTHGASGTPLSVLPAEKSMIPNASFQFVASVPAGQGATVIWSIDSGGGSMDAQTGLFRAPSGPGTTVIRATLADDPTRFATATVTIVRGYVTIMPAGPLQVIPGDTLTLNGVVFDETGRPLADQRLRWSQVVPEPEETAQNNVVANAPWQFMAPTLPGIYRIRATSLANEGAFAEVPIHVTPLALRVTPDTLLVAATRMAQFSCTSGAVIWSVAGVAGGRISPSSGLYTGPNIISGSPALMDDVVTATFVPNVAIQATAQVKVTPLLVTPERFRGTGGATVTLEVELVGAGPLACTWSAVHFPADGGQPEDVTAELLPVNRTGVTTIAATLPSRPGRYRVRAVPTASPSPFYYGESEITVE